MTLLNELWRMNKSLKVWKKNKQTLVDSSFFLRTGASTIEAVVEVVTTVDTVEIVEIVSLIIATVVVDTGVEVVITATETGSSLEWFCDVGAGEAGQEPLTLADWLVGVPISIQYIVT